MPNKPNDWSQLANAFDEPSDLEENDIAVPDGPPRKHKTNHKTKPGLEPPEGEKSVPKFFYSEAPSDVLNYLNGPEQAFVEPPGPVPYAHDPADVILPEQPSFVTDFVNMGRGTEAPTLFLIWGALWTLSAATNRNAWLKWFPKRLWPNLFVLLVAPAGICRKSIAMDFGKQLLETSEQYAANSIVGFENSYRFITSKASPAGLYMMLKPEQKIFIQGQSKLVTAHRSSKITMAIGELATLLTKQQFTTGIVNDITDFYDCRDRGEEITRERGVEPLENIFATLIGGITPTGLEDSIPDEALQGGLVSRMVMVFQDMPTKIYPEPLHFPGYPEPEHLAKKLAWLMHNHTGEYTFTPEAKAAFDEWYIDWKTHVIAGEMSLREDEHRRDVILRKIAMLLRIAEYRPGHEVTAQNLVDARRILDYSLSLSSRLMSGLGGNEFAKNLTRVRDYIEKKRSLTRRQLLNRYGGSITSAELTILVNQLLDQGYIIASQAEKPLLRAAGSPREVYTWTSLEESYANR